MVKAKAASKMNTYKEATAKTVEALLSSGANDIDKIELSITELFPISEWTKAEEAFEKELSNELRGANSTVAKTIPVLHDTLIQGISNVLAIERWISMNIPIMEDGNNFGVGIQMTINEAMKKKRECWTKKLDAIPSYYSSRADAVDKLGLPKATKSESKTETKSDSTGGKDGDQSTTSTTIVKKEENDEGFLQSNHFRLKHLVSIDVQFYASARLTMIDFLNDYMTILDALEKNKEKLTAPKGSERGYGGWN